MATTSLHPKSLSPFLTNPPSFPSPHISKLSFLHPPHHSHCTKRSNLLLIQQATNNKKKNPWLDPFDDGEDPEMEYGSLFTDGKQDEDPRPPDNPDNPYGFLKFPAGFSVEIASLGLKIRGDVRRCCCVVSGGVYENLLFFPAIQLIKDRYPGVQVDIIASARGKQTYELNKNVRWADVYDPDDDFPEPAEYTDMVGLLKMLDWLGRPFRSVPRQVVPPLRVSISRKLKEVVEAKYKKAGAEKGRYIVIHGIESDSKALMQSRGDSDSLLPIEVWDEIAEAVRGFRPVFVIPHDKVREDVEEVVGNDASIVFITTPGQLAALINDSAGVIATNTAAIQLANAREKPSIALFCSEEKGKLFVPNAEEKKCVIVSSKTGKLIDIDIEAVKRAIQIFDVSLALA
ncbi:photosynthetic NDH subunit of subcomplex B 1, chloroplastic isoform X3 [Castanea sativa]|uniref:photosynthetic NDH subunit of subcomplex B 1, chloroplastic isoform X3 n=1 Tax=Castanea sativa TaxID=21020 RepID=UPI003F64B482